jgi:hypothetical protein
MSDENWHVFSCITGETLPRLAQLARVSRNYRVVVQTTVLTRPFEQLTYSRAAGSEVAGLGPSLKNTGGTRRF